MCKKCIPPFYSPYVFRDWKVLILLQFFRKTATGNVLKMKAWEIDPETFSMQDFSKVSLKDFFWLFKASHSLLRLTKDAWYLSRGEMYQLSEEYTD